MQQPNSVNNNTNNKVYQKNEEELNGNPHAER